MIIYQKVMTRDAPLVIVEVWYKCFSESLPAITGMKLPIAAELWGINPDRNQSC